MRNCLRRSVLGLMLSTALTTALPATSAVAIGTGAIANHVVMKAPKTYLSLRYAKHTADEAVQLRSARNGRVTATILPFADDAPIAVSRDAAGDLWTVTTEGCRSTVREIAPTGRTRVIRVLPQPAYDATVSPNHRRIAYLLDYSHCPPGLAPGESEPLPGTLAVTNLATGSTSKTHESQAELKHLDAQSLSQSEWSPNGKHLVVASPTAKPALIFSSTHPSFRHVKIVREHRGCALISPAWGRVGIYAGEICKPHSFSPTRLVRITLAGKVTAAWKLPSCIDGFSASFAADHRHLLIGIGHGYGGCDLAHSTDDAATIQGSRLRIISRDPAVHGDNSWPIGW
jgi:hypothetical protein